MRKMKDSGIEWIGEIPEYWEYTQFKTLLSRNDGGVWGNDPTDTDVDKIVIRSTEQTIDGKWCINNPAKRDLTTENIKDYRIVKNDLLMTKSSGSLDHIGKTSIADEYFTKNECYYSNFIQRLRCYENKYFPKYAWFILNSTIARKQFAYLQNSTSGLGNINSGIINQIKVPLPPLPDQQRIVDFLDRKCSEIDAVIAKTKATIEEYKKLKQSVITEAVTKGIRGDRPMKDSGNIWYGSVPTEWDIRKMKYVFTIKKDIAGKEGYTVLSITLKGVVPKNISSNEGQLAENYSNYQLVAIGDFAMNHMDLLTGWVDISKHEGVTSPDYRVFILNDTINNCKQYYLYLMQMCYSNRIFYGLGQGVSGMGRWRLQADKFLNFTIPIPPTQEQKEIADFLDRKCSEIDNLITKKEQLVVELEAYKKSLIYEVVTGKRIV